MADPIYSMQAEKYSDNELVAILNDENRPILVCTDENDSVMGYCFCIFESHSDSAVLKDNKTLYIDDLCVDENLRGKHIGKELYDAAVKLARDFGCYNLTLNVWECNPGAKRFYEKKGLLPNKTVLEIII